MKKSHNQHQYSPCRPYIAGHAVSPVPVILICQGPRKLDSHGVVLSAFGQVIACRHEHQCNGNAYHASHVDIHTDAGQNNHKLDHHRQQDHKPAGNLLQFPGAADVFTFGVNPVNHIYHHCHEKHKGRYAESGHIAAGITICHIVRPPVGGNQIRQAVIKTDGNDKRHKGRKPVHYIPLGDLPVIFFHVCLPPLMNASRKELPEIQWY